MYLSSMGGGVGGGGYELMQILFKLCHQSDVIGILGFGCPVRAAVGAAAQGAWFCGSGPGHDFAGRTCRVGCTTDDLFANTWTQQRKGWGEQT